MSNYSLSKVMSAASAAYGGYALARPAHLGRALEATGETTHDGIARIVGVRDVVTSLVALASGDRRQVTAAMASRIAFDVGDCVLMRREAQTAQARRRITAITLGWAALNALALAVDRQRAR